MSFKPDGEIVYSAEIMHILKEADDLPSLPGITQKVVSLSLMENISLKEIADVINTDAALVMRILKIVNSAYYGFTNKISDIHQAVSILGGNMIRNIAITLSLIDVFPIKINEEYTNLFKRSLCAAVTADFISQIGGNRPSQDVFLAGMLQNLGMYILMRYLAERYLVIIENAKKYFIRLSFLEKLELGIDHAYMGKEIAKRWELPKSVRLVIEYQGKPALADKADSFSPEIATLLKVTHVGGLVADIYFGWNKAWNMARFKKDMLLLLNYDERTSDDLLSSIPHLMKDAGFNGFAGINNLPTFNDIQKEAQEELRLSWNMAEENFSEFYKLNKKYQQKEKEIKRLKEELQQNQQLLKKIAEKLQSG